MYVRHATYRHFEPETSKEIDIHTYGYIFHLPCLLVTQRYLDLVQGGDS